jgi:hypothetical protein
MSGTVSSLSRSKLADVAGWTVVLGGDRQASSSGHGNVYDATMQAMHEGTTDARLDALGEKIDALGGRMDEKIDDLGRRMDDGFKQVDQRFEQIDRRFEQTDKRFEAVDERSFAYFWRCSAATR